MKKKKNNDKEKLMNDSLGDYFMALENVCAIHHPTYHHIPVFDITNTKRKKNEFQLCLISYEE